jgi:hypothetical protein
MWIPGLLFEDTDGTEKPSQTPENMVYFREYHKACGRKTGNQVGTLRWYFPLRFLVVAGFCFV